MTVTIDISAGTHIRDAILDAMQEARRIEAAVAFDFNGTHLAVLPIWTYDDACAEWLRLTGRPVLSHEQEAEIHRQRMEEMQRKDKAEFGGYVRKPTEAEVATALMMQAGDALAVWDAGQWVLTCEMGGLGPGYELAIQTLAFAVLKQFIGHPDVAKCRASEDADAYERLGEIGDDVAFSMPDEGFSGAQVGAAKGIAFKFAAYGYGHMVGEIPDDRRIMVRRRDSLPTKDTRQC